MRYTKQVEAADGLLSTGSVGDSFDNALAETTIGIYKTELIARGGPFASLDDLELSTMEYVDWYNHRRLHEACAYRPPAEYEALYYTQHHAAANLATAQ